MKKVDVRSRASLVRTIRPVTDLRAIIGGDFKPSTTSGAIHDLSHDGMTVAR